MSQQQHGISIEHKDSRSGGEFVVERENIRLAEMAYSRAGEHLIIISHTQVDDQLRGHGVARLLLDALVSWARETHTRVIATCPYAKAQFDKDASIRDVYDEA